MKKLLSIALASVLLFSCAVAEMTLVDPYAECPVEAALSEYLAGALAERFATPVTVRHEPDAAQAANAFFALPAEEALLLANQGVLIVSLQGYTDQDMRTAVRPAARVAASGSAFYAASSIAETLRDMDPEALTAYTEEHPYELFIARLVDASHNDYLELNATEEMYVDQNLYMSYDEVMEAAADGAPDLLVLSDAMLPDGMQEYRKLFDTDEAGIWQGLFLREQASAERVKFVSEALADICAADAWSALLVDGGYTRNGYEGEEAFTAEVQALIADYIRYLTNEGLFFYEW